MVGTNAHRPVLLSLAEPFRAPALAYVGIEMVMTQGTLEGILHFKDDRSDGQLRDPAHPLRQRPPACRGSRA